ncbi:MAG TPA: response regulator, partial [Polyangiaceae bacterium]|nr:response regulator [Polyangiaceae bacterium]
LVVDDEYASLEVLALLLEAEGYRVLTAADGAEALGRLSLEAADLVITDYMMPRMTGDELCRRMNDEPRLRNVPVIMTTAMFRDDVPPSPQVVALFIKPLRFDKLLAAVRELLGNARPPLP